MAWLFDGFTWHSSCQASSSLSIPSLVPWRYGNNIKSAISGLMSRITFMTTSCKIALRWMPQDTLDDKSSLLQVFTWWVTSVTSILVDHKGPSILQAPYHYCWWPGDARKPGPRFNIKMSSYQYWKSHCGHGIALHIHEFSGFGARMVTWPTELTPPSKMWANISVWYET